MRAFNVFLGERRDAWALSVLGTLRFVRSTRSSNLPGTKKRPAHSAGRLGKIEKEAAKEADLIVTVSHYSLQKLVQLYEVDEAKVRVVPNGVDTQKFKPAEGCEGIKDVVEAAATAKKAQDSAIAHRKELSVFLETRKYMEFR